MNKLKLAILALCTVSPALALAAQGEVSDADTAATGKVQLIRFETSFTPPAYRVSPALRNREQVFRAGLQMLPEGLLVMGALTIGSGQLGLSEAQSTNLTPLVSDVYARIYADPSFSGTPSALPFCFSPTKPSSGQYLMYVPDEIPDEPTCIVFLHGYGGNFQFYTWLLKEEFPDTIILAPSWGASWSNGRTEYVRDMFADARRRLGRPLPRPWLMAISAGGPAGFRIYSRSPRSFRGYVCLASAPRTADLEVLGPELRILMLNGTTDAMIPVETARRQAELARARCPSLAMQELEGNHFFLLSHSEDTFRRIREFIDSARPTDNN